MHTREGGMTTQVVTSNSAQLETGGTWRWSLSVRTSSNALESVSMHLHPTFSPSVVKLTPGGDGCAFHSPTFSGWGTFDIDLKLTFRGDPRPSTITHALSFDHPENTETHEVRRVAVPDPAALLETRARLEAVLRGVPSLQHGDERFFHGRAWTEGDGAAAPEATWTSELRPRDDHGDGPEWLTATEFASRSRFTDGLGEAYL